MDDYSLYLITSKPYEQVLFLKLLTASLEKGVRLVQIRAKELDRDQYKKLSAAAIELCHQYHAKVLLRGKPALIEELGADGLHLPSSEMMQLHESPISNNYILSVACHNAEQVIHASNIRADLAIISPIFSTPSSPNGKPLGWSQFSTLSKLSKIPTYALGGLSLNDLETARLHGATGIAAIRALWMGDNANDSLNTRSFNKLTLSKR